MTLDSSLQARIARLETLLAQKFGAKRGRLDRRALKAGRRLPRGVRRDLAAVAQAQGMGGHPKLARMVDANAVSRAAERAEAHLSGIDVADRRKGALLGILGALAFNLIVLVGLALAVLRWRGLI